jgi:acyl-CoA synthetase (NDP forming)
MPERASVRNPVDFGAAMGSLSVETRLHVVELLLATEAIGGVVVHGYGAPGFLPADAPEMARQGSEADKVFLRSLQALQSTHQKPVLFATAMTSLESQAVQELIAEGLRFQHRLDDAAAVMAALWQYAHLHRSA